jgi:hypothetical protein
LFLLFFSNYACSGFLAKSLNIPIINDEWVMNVNINGNVINLSIPQDSSLLDKYPHDLKNYINKKIEYRKKNITLLTDYSNNLEHYLQTTSFRHEMEYERELEEIVISIHPSDISLKDPLNRHWPLIDQLPNYTRIILYTPKEMHAIVKKNIKNKKIKNKITVYPIETWSIVEDGINLKHTTTRWAQDLFETTKDLDGVDYIISPATRYQINDLSRADNRYLSLLTNSNRKLLKTPFFFRAGNIVSARTNKKYLFVGEREVINNNNDFFNTVLEKTNSSVFLSTLKKLFGAETHIVLPNSNNLFHLDLYLTFVADGVVLLIEPIDPENLAYEDKLVLDNAKEILIKNSFKIIPLPTTALRIKKFQSVANILLFRNRNNKQLSALVPAFKDSFLADNTSLNKLTNSAYLKAGIIVIPVTDKFYSVNGNTHCAVSVLH